MQSPLYHKMGAYPSGSCGNAPPGDGAATVTTDVPLMPSAVAVIVAAPAAMPVTTPLPLAVATPAALVAQLTNRPLSTLPLASFSVALSCTVCPTATLAVAGLTVTDATGAVLAAVVPVTTFESAPKVGPWASVPR